MLAKLFHLVTTALLATATSAEIVSNRETKLAGGTFRYFYDDSFSGTPGSSPCDSVVISIVGTAMTIGAYEELATSIVTGRGTVAIIMDNNPHNIQKQNGGKAAKVANAIVEHLSKHVPICDRPPSKGILFGGHSAGGGERSLPYRRIYSSLNSLDSSVCHPMDSRFKKRKKLRGSMFPRYCGTLV